MQQDTQYLVDILHLAQRILDQTATSSLSRFYDDIQLQDSTIRRLLKIGKTARRISPRTRQQVRNINWALIDDMKGRLVQDTDPDWIWTLIQTEIPILVQAIRSQISSEGQGGFFEMRASRV